jgi:hypothetical protein
LLAVDVENNTVPGYEFSSWEKGYNDMAMIPVMSTLRLVPWIPHTAMVMADLQTTDHEPVTVAPRSLLQAQIDRLAYAHTSFFTTEVAESLGVSLSEVQIAEFANGEIHCKFGESIRGADLFIFQSHASTADMSVNDALMEELNQVNRTLQPHQVFLVVDAMTGQDAVNSAKAFHQKLEVDGFVLTKFDSDTRGGAAISVKHVTGANIRFVGVGEKLDALEEFHAERMAGRILGMGDVVSLVERAREQVSDEDAEKINAKLAKGELTMDDFLKQLRTLRRMGPLVVARGRGGETEARGAPSSGWSRSSSGARLRHLLATRPPSPCSLARRGLDRARRVAPRASGVRPGRASAARAAAGPTSRDVDRAAAPGPSAAPGPTGTARTGPGRPLPLPRAAPLPVSNPGLRRLRRTLRLPATERPAAPAAASAGPLVLSLRRPLRPVRPHLPPPRCP